MGREALRSRYIKYIEKICKDKTLKGHAIDFFDDLCERFKDKTFKRDDFETLEIDGQVFEQDVVTDCLKDKEAVSLPEVFVYLVEKNLNSIKFAKRKNFIDGKNSFSKKELLVYKSNPGRFFKSTRVSLPAPLRTQGMTDKEFAQLYDDVLKQERKINYEADVKALKTAEEELKKHYMHVFYHEISHILELQTFGDRKYVRSHFLSDCYYIQTGKNKYQTKEEKESKKRFFGKRKENEESEDYTKLFIFNGQVALSEMINEDYADFVGKTHDIRFADRLTSVNSNNRTIYYSSRKKKFGECGYNDNYDFVLLFKALLGDVELRDYVFNNQDIVECINSCNMDLSKIHNEIAQAINLTLGTSIDSNFKKPFRKSLEDLKGLDLYQSLCFMFGFTELHYKSYEKDLRDLAPSLRIITQKIMVDCIKQKYLQDIVDESVPKDEKFYKKLNNALISIDDYLLYRYDDIIIRQEVEGEGVKDKYYKSNEILPARKLIEDYPEEAHLQSFADFIEMVKNIVAEAPKDVDTEEIMTWFSSQAELESEYNALLEKQNLVIEKEKKAEMEARRRYEMQWMQQLEEENENSESRENVDQPELEDEWF